jgi:hypothetical protein
LHQLQDDLDMALCLLDLFLPLLFQITIENASERGFVYFHAAEFRFVHLLKKFVALFNVHSCLLFVDAPETKRLWEMYSCNA